MSESWRSESGPRTKGATIRVSELAGRQWGVVARAQLADCGMSAGAVARAVRHGRLVRVHRGVYAVGHRSLPVEGRALAALLYAGRGAALSHTTAAYRSNDP